VKAPYDVNLTQLDDGSILVRVGCKLLSYRPRDPELLADLTAYFNDPQATIKRFSGAFGWPLEQAAGPGPSQSTEPYPEPYRPFRDGIQPPLGACEVTPR
jgi:hypothetical protein